jgi:hypothetical protein
MNINFEDEFLNNISTFNVKDKYLDEYLKNTRHNLLLFNNLNDEYQLLQNNHIVDGNKHFYQYIDTIKRDSLQYKIKQLVLKQRKLYNNFTHYYNTTVTNNQTLSTPTVTPSIKSQQKTRELKLPNTIQMISNIFKSTEKKELTTHVKVLNKSNNSSASIFSRDVQHNDDSKSIRSTRSTRSVRSIQSTRSDISVKSGISIKSNVSNASDVSNASSGSSNGSSKKSYKINRPDKPESIVEQKKPKFAKFFVKKQ